MLNDYKVHTSTCTNKYDTSSWKRFGIFLVEVSVGSSLWIIVKRWEALIWNQVGCCNTICGCVWLITQVVNWGSWWMFVYVHVCSLYFPMQFGSVGYSFSCSSSFLQMKSHTSKQNIHILLSSLIHQLVGPNLHFKTSFTAELIKSLLYLASCLVMSIQWW